MIKERIKENKAHSFPYYQIFRNGLQKLVSRKNLALNEKSSNRNETELE